MSVDFGRQSDAYAEHRPGFPAWFYDRLETFVLLRGVSAVDLGTGPGKIAVELAARGASVTGVDISDRQIAAARRVASERGVDDRCEFLVAPAEETGLESACADIVTAGQCWVWFDNDRAVAESARLLRPGGLLVVAHYCYLAPVSDIARRTEELVLEHNPTWTMAGDPGLYPQQIVDLTKSGEFELVEQFCRDNDEWFTHEAWRGRMRTCNGVGSGTMTEAQIDAFDRDLAELLRREFPDEPMAIHHRVWATIVSLTGLR